MYFDPYVGLQRGRGFETLAFPMALEYKETMYRLPEDIRKEGEKVLSFSRFVRRTVELRPEILEDLIDTGDLACPYRGDTPIQRFRALKRLFTREAYQETGSLMKDLRVFRAREMVRIAWRDISGLSDTKETLMDLSLLAEAVLSIAVRNLAKILEKGYGIPTSYEGEPQDLVVLGMGKLGGRELNFSSDIDLIFSYPRPGKTDHPTRPITNQQFFERLSKELIKVVGAATEDGFVFRVDTRLRPFGASGPLCMSFDQMEDYYEIHGREWERYALIKARPLTGDPALGIALIERLRPFVYRRYLDYGAIESLRQMKALIEKGARSKGYEYNIKLGLGGIREIEFIVQAFQLIHGGKEPDLRCRSTLKAIETLKRLGMLPGRTALELEDAYLFLRLLENRLQEHDDQRVHTLPKAQEEMDRLARSLGLNSGAALSARIKEKRDTVRRHFDGLFGQKNHEGQRPDIEEDLMALWEGVIDQKEAIIALKALGFRAPEEVIKEVSIFRHSRAFQSMTERSKRFLQRIIPRILLYSSGLEDPDSALKRSIEVIETIGRRGFYLALLAENKGVLKGLVQFAGRSSWIARYLSQHPDLIDGLISMEWLGEIPGKKEIEKALRGALRYCALDDIETFMETIRHFKNTYTFRLAYLAIEKGKRAEAVGRGLSCLAEAILEEAATNAWMHLEARHGSPFPAAGASNRALKGFLVVGYGKLGSRELTFSSDLDLVFLHGGEKGMMTPGGSPLEAPLFYARLGQRIIHILTTYTPSGRAYKVDMRLRPDGAGGVLVSSIQAFVRYQMESAWQWEHQALLRARPIAGDETLRTAFKDARKRILMKKRDGETLRREVLSMRERMLSLKGRKRRGVFHLKHDPGGTTDIEFMVQYYCLLNAALFPSLLEETSTICHLRLLGKLGIIHEEMAKALEEVYDGYLRLINQRFLSGLPIEMELEPRLNKMRKVVRAAWQRTFCIKDCTSRDIPLGSP